jgi:hypothetical protein
MTNIDAKLHVNLIQRLNNCHGVSSYVRDIPILALNNSELATNLFLYYLRTFNAIYEKGPIIRLYFGNSSYPYIDPLYQECILKLIVKCGIEDDCCGNIQYNSNKSIYSMYSDLHQLPILKEMDPEKMICEMNIIYSNIVIILPIKI